MSFVTCFPLKSKLTNEFHVPSFQRDNNEDVIFFVHFSVIFSFGKQTHHYFSKPLWLKKIYNHFMLGFDTMLFKVKYKMRNP